MTLRSMPPVGSIRPPVAAVVLAWLLAAFVPAPVAETPRSLEVGSLTLTLCRPGLYCGRLDRPLDPTGVLPDRIGIFFEFAPPGDASMPSQGTLVAAEGGPGYPTTGSAETYLTLFDRLRDHRAVVLMDNRGTGRSGAIDCTRLQTAAGLTVADVTACGQQLGERAPLYSTGYAADDLAAILDALGAGPIDLYGDSYGTWFAQTFAIRHGGQLRSIVLDGAYPVPQVQGESPWWPFYAPAMRRKFDLVCARAESCRRIPGSSIDHIRPALELLRAHPFEATALDADGRPHRFRADAARLALVAFAATPTRATARETDPAARAFAAGDRAPLLRLMAEALATSDSRDETRDPVQYSQGLFMAINCRDADQIFDMTLPPADRARQRDRVIAAEAQAVPDLYAPFTLAEFRGLPLDYEFLDPCVGWPVPPTRFKPHDLFPDGAVYPDVPALVVSGELDDITTAEQGAIAAGLFRRGRHVIVANSFHVNALSAEQGSCVPDLVRRFIATLDPGDIACAAAVPPLRPPAAFPRHVAELAPAAARPGTTADERRLRLAAAALWTAADVVARLESRQGKGRGPGLRGGGFTTAPTGPATRMTLDGVRWTEDLAVSGTVDVPPGPGMVQAILTLAGPDHATGRLNLAWPVGTAESVARIDGTIDGVEIGATAGAP
jgi:pimeloyl-ACP methyl ester carboxylesterase